MNPATHPSGESQPQGLTAEWTLKDFWHIVRRRRWLIAGLALGTTVAAAMFALTMTPLYRATATVVIERKGVKISEDVERLETGSYAYESFYTTQYKILGSDAVLRRAVDRLDLPNRPGVVPDPDDASTPEGAAGVRPAAPSLPPELAERLERLDSPLPKLDPADEQRFLKFLRTRLSVAPELGSHLVNLHFDHLDPEFAAEAANAVAASYIEFSREEKLDIATQSEGFFADRVQALREETIDAQTRLQRYARDHGIVSSDAQAAALEKLSDLTLRLTEANSRVAGAAAELASLKTASPDQIPEVQSHALVQELTRRLADNEAKQASLLSRFGSDHPELKRLLAERNRIMSLLAEKQVRVAVDVLGAKRVALEEAEQRAERLEELRAGAQAEVNDLEAALIEYEQLKVEVDRKKSTLADLLTRRNNMLLAASMGESATQNVRVINPAVAPLQAFKPNKTRMVLIGMLLGLFLGVGLSVLIEALDESLKSPEDLATATGLPVLAEVPEMRSVTGASRVARRGARSRSKGPGISQIVTAVLPRSPEAEAYRELRTSYLTMIEGRTPQSLLITSSVPSEGKSTTAVNLAVTLAKLEHNVLLVDTDLRRPTLHRVLKLSSAGGVSNVLAKGTSFATLVQPTHIENVSLLAAGPLPGNPAELLDSRAFAKLVRELRERTEYDFVIFDSPPVMSVVDPLLIGRHTDGSLLVARAGTITRKVVGQALGKLTQANVRLHGSVLNVAKPDSDGYGGYRYYRYGYGYGHGRSKGDESSEKSVAGKRKGPRVAAIPFARSERGERGDSEETLH